MRKPKKFTIDIENGLYIGDLCYALGDSVYDKVWGKQYGYEDGAYTDPKTKLQFAMVGTAYGDGCYSGTDGRSYPVDAGIIGICDAKLVEKNIRNLGRIIPQAKGSYSIEFYEGVITIKNADADAIITQITTAQSEKGER